MSTSWWGTTIACPTCWPRSGGRSSGGSRAASSAGSTSMRRTGTGWQTCRDLFHAPYGGGHLQPLADVHPHRPRSLRLGSGAAYGWLSRRLTSSPDRVWKPMHLQPAFAGIRPHRARALRQDLRPRPLPPHRLRALVHRTEPNYSDHQRTDMCLTWEAPQNRLSMSGSVCIAPNYSDAALVLSMRPGSYKRRGTHRGFRTPCLATATATTKVASSSHAPRRPH
jgi:hypothetical protein